MNNCLADLSRLIPSSYLKKGRGRIEKTEIIEMAIKHIKHLQHHPCTKQDGCELAQEIETGLSKASSVESFRVGYHECLTETMHFLVEKEGLYSGNSFCVRLMAHLQKHFDKLGRGTQYTIHIATSNIALFSLILVNCSKYLSLGSRQGIERLLLFQPAPVNCSVWSAGVGAGPTFLQRPRLEGRTGSPPSSQSLASAQRSLATAQ